MNLYYSKMRQVEKTGKKIGKYNECPDMKPTFRKCSCHFCTEGMITAHGE